VLLKLSPNLIIYIKQFQKFFVGLLCISLAFASPDGLDGEFYTITGIQGLPLEGRSAPGIVQPLTKFEDTFEPQQYDTLVQDDYGVPKFVEEYGPPEVPKIYDDYGPPEVPHDEYGPPEEPHEEYGPPPAPLCSNGAPDTSYPFCCENGAANPYCCIGQWINPTCSEPTTTTTTPAPLCLNGAPDTSYPYCCENGAANPYCCVGQWINPTCSEPTTTTPVPSTVRFAPYPEPTTTTTPAPFVPKSPYAGKVNSKYEDSHLRGDFDTGSTRKTVKSGEGLISVRGPETVGVTRTIPTTKFIQGDFKAVKEHAGGHVKAITGHLSGMISGGNLRLHGIASRIDTRSIKSQPVFRSQVRSRRSGISGKLHTLRFVKHH
jgi:hypothetical protein